MSVCLDAYAMLSWLQEESGAALVEGYLERAVREPDFACYVSIINLGEVIYRLYRTRGSEEAGWFWEDAMRGEVPVTVIDATPARVREAAFLKGQYRLAYADAFAVQLAMEKGLTLVTGDPEISSLHEDGLLSVEWTTLDTPPRP